MTDRSRAPNSLRTWLRIEPLEDRTTPTAALVTDPTSYAAGHVIVSLAGNATPASAGLVASPLASGVQSIGLGMFQVNLREGVSVGQAISVFSGANGVLFVEPDYTLGVQLTPNDPNYTSGGLWGLHNTGQSGGVADADIDAPEAWDIARGTGTKIVAVIDTGVDYNHPDLNANMWRNPGETAGDGVDNDGNGWVDDIYGADFVNNDGNPMDDNNHGTHCAGTIGGVGNNTVGVTGVAWTTRIMALKFLGASGSGSTSNAVRAIDYAIAKGAKILNNSWGGGGYSLALEQAITRAQTAGVIFVAAAGNAAANNDTTANYPSNYPVNNVVAVASTTRTDAMSSFSSYGATTVDLGAPGSNILSTTPNNSYSIFSGTSMATPHVAGALAVFWDANPSLSYSEVIQKLLQSVDPLASLAGRTVSGGRLNLKKLLDLGGGSPPPPADVTGARVTSGVFAGQQPNGFDRVRVTFNEAINAASFTTGDIVSLTGPGGAITPTGVTPVAGSNTQFDVTFATQTTVGAYSIVLGPDILDTATSPNAMDQNQDGQNGQANDTYSLAATLAPSRSVFSATAVPAPIRDFTTTTVNIVVPSGVGLDGTSVTDLNLSVSLAHTWVGDLRITLIAPDGTSVRVFNRHGSSGDNLSGTTFDDEAGTSISNGSAPYSGSFRPFAALTGFDGKNPVGTWRLQVYDAGRSDIGTLTAASISVAVGGGGQSVHTFGTRDEVTVERPRRAKWTPRAVGVAVADFVAKPPVIAPPTNTNWPTPRDGGPRLVEVPPEEVVKRVEKPAAVPAFDHMAVTAATDWFKPDTGKGLIVVI
jgi:serine protease